VESENIHYYFYDANGNVGQFVNDQSGEIAAHYEYDPFGKLINSYGKDAISNSYRFSTKYDDDTGCYYYGQRYYLSDMGRWLNMDPIREAGGVNLYEFSNNNAVGEIDVLGLDVYVVYREFNDDILKLGYRNASPLGIGHFYLAFDNENVDLNEWNRLVDSIGPQENPFRNSSSKSETFSFHPWSVRDGNDTSSDIASTIYTLGSYIGYNDRVDRDAFINAKNSNLLESNDLLQAKLFRISTNQHQQFDLYRAAIASRSANNACTGCGDFGTYKLFLNNCGSWAVFMIESNGMKIPNGVRSRNIGGGGIGGVQDYLPLTYTITAGAMAYGYTKEGIREGLEATAETVSGVARNVNRLIEQSGGKFGAIPLGNGDYAAGITWHFD
jgi:RHS repeat-associated protein